MRKLKPLVALLSSALLTACAATTETREGTAAQICRSWQPITVSRKDVLTDRTAQEIAGSNAGNEQWCGKRDVPREQQRVARSYR